MTHASVFSGIGGPEVAAAMLGWENLFHCEINPFGRAVLEYWFPNATSYEDITTTDFSEWGGRVNVLTGGFPCQPFSYAGQRRGSQDDRYLWPYMHRCINQVRPDWVVCENVAGILTMVEQGDVTEMAAEKSLFDEGDTLYRYRLEATFTLERICNDLESDGYAVQAVVIPACAVNAPHRRDRVFIIGHRIVADTDNGANGRTARKNEANGRDQRLQERHEVRQPDQPTQVRPTAEGYVPDSIRKGLEGKDQPRCGKGGERLHLRRDPARCNRQDDQERATATDTDCCGEGTPRKGSCVEGCRGNEDKLTGQRGAEAKRDSGFHAVLRTIADPNSNGQCSCCRPSGRAREKMDSRGAGKPFNGIERLGASRPATDTTGRIATGESGQAARQDGQLDAEPAINGGVLPKSSADTESQQGGRLRPEQPECGEPQQGEFGGRNQQDGRGGFDSNPDNEGLERDASQRVQGHSGRRQQREFCFATGDGSEASDTHAGLGRWDEFPTQSPVHRGNDGIPFPLDNLTISPSKWRTESLKAYGNAIVPQVMYEIFRAIEETEKQHRS